jgi:hypothetical protein
MKTVESSAVFQPKQWAEKEAGKTIENRTQTELVPNQASKSNIVRGALKLMRIDYPLSSPPSAEFEKALVELEPSRRLPSLID